MSSSAKSVADRAARVLTALPDDPAVLVGIVGPTASGKTELAVELAERLGGEIVSIDSVQIYQRFDVGSGKPSPDELRRAPHHLVSEVAPDAALDAATFVALADRAIADVRGRGKRVVLCGGTYLWAKALLRGLASAPKGSAEVRARLEAEAARDGRPSLHARLAEIDPASAQRLHPNDFVRVSRALEVYELSGRPLSEWQRDHAFAEQRYPSALFALDVEKDALTRRIEARVDAWLTQGWVDEVAKLRDDGLGGARAMGSVGYHEVFEHVEGRLPKEELRAKIVQSTRIFARRQRTWLNHEPVVFV